MRGCLISAHIPENINVTLARVPDHADEYIPAEELDLKPIVCDKDTISQREECTNVGTSPEEEGRNTARSQLQRGQ